MYPRFKTNIYYALILRITILIILFTLTRIIFFLFNKDYFTNLVFKDIIMIFIGGLRFDISAIFILNLPFIFLQSIPFNFRNSLLYRHISNTYFYIINSIALLANCVDFIYFRFTLKRTTADFFKLIITGEDTKNILPQIIKDFWYVPLIWIILLIIMVYLYKRANYYDNKKYYTIRYYFRNFIYFVLVSGITIIGARGGLQMKPINIISASQYANANNIPLVLNTPFTIIKTIKGNSLEKVRYFKDEKELRHIYNPWHENELKTQNLKLKTINVVIIILESFSKEHIYSLCSQPSAFSLQQTITPFLDSLIHESLVFPNAFANGRKSIEGIPAVLAGIPTLMNDPFITSGYSGDKFYSLANLLKAEGYNTSFYHGGTNGTMGFDNFCKASGFDNYYGRYEYNDDKDYDGRWGIFDEPFLQYFARSLDKTQQPFLTSVFTLSSHHPYTVPAKYKNILIYGNNFQRCISYTDFALKRFFETASKMKWFDNTLFVITADHTSQIYNKAYDNRLGAYEIPIIFYRHKSAVSSQQSAISPRFDSTITQQIDIMPSILDYIDYNKPYLSFGNSVFGKNLRTTNNEQRTTNFAISYLNNTYQIVGNDYVLQFDGKKYNAVYDRENDHSLKNNLINCMTNTRVENFKTLGKAVIQSYNQRLIENKLTIDN